MNVLDPFNLYRSPAIRILQGQATRTAAHVTQKVLDTGAQAFETGKQVVEEMKSIPQNVPSFANSAQREMGNKFSEDVGVSARLPRSGNGGVVREMQDKMGSLFGEREGALPMYKDKPYNYVAPRRKWSLWKRRRGWGFIAFVIFLLYMFGAFQSDTRKIRRAKAKHGWFSFSGSGTGIDWLSRREEVKGAFIKSWDAYERYAWGYDAYQPISRQGKQYTPDGMGWIIIDSLDTLILMNLTTRLTHARDWLSTKLDYNQDYETNTFEAGTRMLGGLLSAYYLSTEYPDMAPLKDDDEGAEGEDLYLEKAKDLADRLMGAFETPSGVPTININLKTMRGSMLGASNGVSSTAEVAALQLELKYMSKVTGEGFYWQEVEKVNKAIDDNGLEGGLVPAGINPQTGKVEGQLFALGSKGSSYYEHLLKNYLQTSKEEPVYEQLWNEALVGIRKFLVAQSYPSGFTVVGEHENGLHTGLTTRIDHTVCSLPGLVALGATDGLPESELNARSSNWRSEQAETMTFARELMKTCWAMNKVTATGLAPEVAHFKVDTTKLVPKSGPETLDESPEASWRQDLVIGERDTQNLQQAQTVESLFYMWRISGDIKYREWGWELFKSFMSYTAVADEGGFTSLADANTIPPVTQDNMERFWLSETLKYFYLLFSPNDLLPLDQIVINTAGHIMPRFKLAPLFSTGWKRQPRDANGELIRQVVEPVETVLDEQVVIKRVTKTVMM